MADDPTTEQQPDPRRIAELTTIVERARRDLADDCAPGSLACAAAIEMHDVLMAECVGLRAQLDEVRQWAMKNEIDKPPLDWAGLGAILCPKEAQ